MQLEPGAACLLVPRSRFHGPLPARQQILHQGLVMGPAAASLYDGLVQVVDGQLQGLPGIDQLLVQVREKRQTVAPLVARHTVGIDRDAEDLAEHSVGVVIVGLDLCGRGLARRRRR